MITSAIRRPNSDRRNADLSGIPSYAIIGAGHLWLVYGKWLGVNNAKPLEMALLKGSLAEGLVAAKLKHASLWRFTMRCPSLPRRQNSTPPAVQRSASKGIIYGGIFFLDASAVVVQDAPTFHTIQGLIE